MSAGYLKKNLVHILLIFFFWGGGTDSMCDRENLINCW